jgi:molybdopterin molybdotransferase
LPGVTIFSTGKEIKPVDFPVEQFQLRDSNSYTIAASLKHFGIEPSVRKIVQDDLHSLITAIQSVLTYNILILSGGVSAGDADFVPAALKECGVEEIFHKVKIKPGKPIWFGKHPNGLRVFALPGNPFAVQVACKIFIEPYLRSCFGLTPAHPLSIPISIERKKRVPFDEFFPAGFLHNNSLEVEPLSFNGSGDISAILNSAGIVRHSSAANDLTKGERVEFYPWNNIS